MAIKNRSKRILKEKEMSIRELSRRSGYEFESVRRFVNNIAPSYTRDMLEKMCRVLGVDVGEMLYMDMYDEEDTSENKNAHTVGN